MRNKRDQPEQPSPAPCRKVPEETRQEREMRKRGDGITPKDVDPDYDYPPPDPDDPQRSGT